MQNTDWKKHSIWYNLYFKKHFIVDVAGAITDEHE